MDLLTPLEPIQAETPAPRVWETFSLIPPRELREDRHAYPFQDYAVYLALQVDRFVIGAATGLGKTFMSFQIWKYLRQRDPRTRLLVITTKSATLQFVNEHDAFYRVPVKAVGIHRKMPRSPKQSYAEARRQAYLDFGATGAGATDLMVMNHSLFRRDINEILIGLGRLRDQGIPYVFVVDEATVVKNPETNIHRCVNTVSRYAVKTLLLTATLTKGKLEEIYGILCGVNLGGVIATNRDNFYRDFCITYRDPDRPGDLLISGYKSLAEFAERIAPYSIVLRKVDVADFLPRFVLKTLFLPHSKEQYHLISDIYKSRIDVRNFKRESHDLTGEDEALALARSAPNPVIEIERLSEGGYIKRALLDPRLVHRQGLADYTPAHYSPKTEALIDFLRNEATGEKIVVYTPSKVYLKLLAQTIRHASGLDQYYRDPLVIHGDVNEMEREASRVLFQDGSSRRLMLVNDAGIQSLNLQSGSIMVVLGMPSSGGDLIQLAGRLSRLGSVHSSLMMAFFLTDDSQDMDEYSIMQRQMQLSALVLGESEQGLLDWKHLRAVDDITDDTSDAEYRDASMACLTMLRRTRRAGLYAALSARELVEA